MISDARLRAALALGSSSPDPDLLADVLRRAVAFVERQTHRHFGEPAETQVIIAGNGTRHLRLPDPPSDPDYVSVTEQRYPGDATTLLGTPGDFVVRPVDTTAYLARAGGNVWEWGREYVVTFERGYQEDQGPADIEALLIELVGRRLATMGSDGLASETIGGYSYSRPAIHAFEDGDLRSIPGAVRTLDYWRLPVLS